MRWTHSDFTKTKNKEVGSIIKGSGLEVIDFYGLEGEADAFDKIHILRI